MKTTIASVNCYDRFLKTISKILQTFFSYILEAQQFTLAKVTLNQVLSTQVNSSRLDKVQNMPVEKILSADFFSLELVNGAERRIAAPNTNGSFIWNNFQDQTFTAKVAISPKNIGKMPQNLLKKIFWKINFIKMIKIFICDDSQKTQHSYRSTLIFE